jgi:hypothetical protein
MPNLDGSPTAAERQSIFNQLSPYGVQPAQPVDPNAPTLGSSEVMPPPEVTAGPDPAKLQALQNVQAPASAAPNFDPAGVDPILQQQIAQAHKDAQPAGFMEKLGRGLLGLPGIRQTAGRVAAPFLPDREEAAKNELGLTEKLATRMKFEEAQKGDLASADAFAARYYGQDSQFMKDYTSRPPEARAAFMKDQMEMLKTHAETGNKLAEEGHKKTSEAHSAETLELGWANYNARVAERGIVRQASSDAKEEKSYLRDEKDIRDAQLRAEGAARTGPYITRLMVAKTGADDVHQLIQSSTQGGEGGKIILSAPSVGEVMAALQRTLTMGGESSVEMMRSLTPNSMWGDTQKMKEYLLGRPQEKLTQAQFDNLRTISERQQIFLGNKLQTFYGGVKRALAPVFLRDSARSKDGKSYLESVFDQGMQDVTQDIGRKGGSQKVTSADIDTMSADELKTYLGEK